jgi:hypothetical protein
MGPFGWQQYANRTYSAVLTANHVDTAIDALVINEHITQSFPDFPAALISGLVPAPRLDWVGASLGESETRSKMSPIACQGASVACVERSGNAAPFGRYSP